MSKDTANRVFWALAVWIGALITGLLTAVTIDLAAYILERTHH